MLLPALPNPCLYLAPASAEADLRITSVGTRYRQARVNYHPYARVTPADRPARVAGLHQPVGRLRPARVSIALASGLKRVTSGELPPAPSHPLSGMVRRVAFAAHNARHSLELPGSCFKKYDTTLVLSSFLSSRVCLLPPRFRHFSLSLRSAFQRSLTVLCSLSVLSYV